MFPVVLVIAVATALTAITHNNLYEKRLNKEGQSGLVLDWSIEDKVLFVDWMVERALS